MQKSVIKVMHIPWQLCSCVMCKILEDTLLELRSFAHPGQFYGYMREAQRSHVNATEHLFWQVNIGSGNGLVLSSNKPLPEPMLTQIYVAIYVTRQQWVNTCFVVFRANRGLWCRSFWRRWCVPLLQSPSQRWHSRIQTPAQTHGRK